MKDVIIFILLATVVMLFFKRCESPGATPEKIIKTVTTVRVDTITKYIERIVVPKPVRTVEVKYVRIPAQSISDTTYIDRVDSVYVALPINVYKDSIILDSFQLTYEHRIAGLLEGSKYKIDYLQTTKVIEKTKLKRRKFSLFAVGGLSVTPQVDYLAGIDLVAQKYKFGYRFGIRDGHSIDFGVRLF